MYDNVQDDEEEQADRYAIELLTGKSGTCFQTGGRWPSALDLARLARRFGTANCVDPGHVVLNWAHSTSGSVWGIANAALKVLDATPDAIGDINERLEANLDWGNLPEDDCEFLMKITRKSVAEEIGEAAE